MNVSWCSWFCWCSCLMLLCSPLFPVLTRLQVLQCRSISGIIVSRIDQTWNDLTDAMPSDDEKDWIELDGEATQQSTWKADVARNWIVDSWLPRVRWLPRRFRKPKRQRSDNNHAIRKWWLDPWVLEEIREQLKHCICNDEEWMQCDHREFKNCNESSEEIELEKGFWNHLEFFRNWTWWLPHFNQSTIMCLW